MYKREMAPIHYMLLVQMFIAYISKFIVFISHFIVYL